MRCSVMDDRPFERAFLAKRGFVERRRSWRSLLEVRSADTRALSALTRQLASEGIQVTTLRSEGVTDPATVRRLYDLDVRAGRYVPRLGTYRPPSFEQFRGLALEGPLFLPEAWHLAKAGDRYVGLSSATRAPARPALLQQGFTGTLPEFRRRKIALTLKLAVIEYAQRSGYEQIQTWNDSLNDGMWSLNQRLGFRRAGGTIETEALLDPHVTANPPRPPRPAA
jgi:GNAT superfamily N-acetyltransferase